MREFWAVKIINLGEKVLPKQVRTKHLISNLMVTGHIKGFVDNDQP